MLPNVGGVLKSFTKKVVLQRVTQEIIEHKPVENISEVEIEAVVQPANKESLTLDNVNYSLSYIQINTTIPIKIGDYVLDKGKKYKIVELEDFSDYGFYKAIGEEVK